MSSKEMNNFTTHFNLQSPFGWKCFGLVLQIIGQQRYIKRYINRLIFLIDAIIGASAKNLLLVPEEAIPENMDLSDYMEEWSKVNGVILYKAKIWNSHADIDFGEYG